MFDLDNDSAQALAPQQPPTDPQATANIPFFGPPAPTGQAALPFFGQPGQAAAAQPKPMWQTMLHGLLTGMAKQGQGGQQNPGAQLGAGLAGILLPKKKAAQTSPDVQKIPDNQQDKSALQRGMKWLFSKMNGTAGQATEQTQDTVVPPTYTQDDDNDDDWLYQHGKIKNL